MKPKWTWTWIIVPSIILMLVGPAAGAAKAPLDVALQATSASGGETVTLMAKVTNDSGRPMGMRDVTFFAYPVFFGRRPVELGSGRTDVTGTAKVTWVPRYTGKFDVEAKVAGDSRYAAAKARVAMEAEEAAPAPVHKYVSRRPLPMVRQTFGAVVGGLTAGVWVLLLVVTFGTLNGLLRQN